MVNIKMNNVITVEPTGDFTNFPEMNTILYSDELVSVRNMTDTPDDRAFAARLTIDAFREKVVHATSESSVTTVVEGFEHFMHDQIYQFYERNFIAEYDGEKAGLVTIKLHGDLAERDNGGCDSLGCCDKLGLFCMNSTALDGKSVPKGKCYVDHVCVEDKFRGKGIGKVLMEFCDKEARRNGCKSIFLDVATTNRAKTLYEREGYVIQETIYGCCWSYWCTLGVKSFYRMEKML